MGVVDCIALGTVFRARSIKGRNDFAASLGALAYELSPGLSCGGGGAGQGARVHAARDVLPAENRRALFEEISAAMGLDEVAIPFAEAVPVPDDAPAIDRLVAWNGRDPSH